MGKELFEHMCERYNKLSDDYDGLYKEYERLYHNNQLMLEGLVSICKLADTHPFVIPHGKLKEIITTICLGVELPQIGIELPKVGE